MKKIDHKYKNEFPLKEKHLSLKLQNNEGEKNNFRIYDNKNFKSFNKYYIKPGFKALSHLENIFLALFVVCLMILHCINLLLYF